MTEHLLALAAVTLVLVAIPGPNVALIVASSLGFGFRAGLLTVLGTTAGVALQLVLVVLGLALLVEVLAGALAWIKWAGVAYLAWLGIRTWRQPPEDLDARPRGQRLFGRAALIAALNPKTLLFNAAFLPQFVAAGGGGPEIALVAVVFLAVLAAGDTLWAVFAGSARPLLRRAGRLRNRLAGGFLLAAGAGLALSRRV